ncbi:MAG TPA: UbiA family prenyltransferase, partial [Novosphingobium sp.]|nr:UbiA family prenyltransferase [Novosphingobium sp.]
MTAPLVHARLPDAADAPVPLVVDVDATLVRADISLESFVRVARSGLVSALLLLLALLRGRSIAKALAARRDPVDPARLPYRAPVLDLIREAVSAGRPVILASASHRRNVARIARHLGLAEPVIASSARANLKGRAKLAAIRARIGADGPFDYAGDSRADAVLWAAARRGYSAGWMPGSASVERIGPPPPPLAASLLRALRPHQWAKNALVLVPLFASGAMLDPGKFALALVAMAAMSAIASSIYLVNDLLDIDADRAHATKWRRPIAHGDITVPQALAGAIVLGLGGLATGWLAGGPLLAGWLLAYMVVSLAYSLRIKAVLAADAIALAMLYTLRLAVGGAAVQVAVSYWLLLFS